MATDRVAGVRTGHELDQPALKSYLDARASAIPGWCQHATLSVSQFNHGQSNPTYLLTATTTATSATAATATASVRAADDAAAPPPPPRTHKYVLRKRPRMVKVATAHAVDREFAVLSALQSSQVPVPAFYLLCLDFCAASGYRQISKD